jgi:hypothetical protein
MLLFAIQNDEGLQCRQRLPAEPPDAWTKLADNLEKGTLLKTAL